jgi:diphthamide synthase (EF-2-diphthine--ammonia ligase)
VKALLFWSGGKDSALALHKVQNRNDIEVEKLVTSFSEETSRSSIHGVPEKLIEYQAENIGLGLEKISIPENCSMKKYQEITAENLNELSDQNFEAAVFGDIFLESVLEKREETMKKTDLETVLPICGEETNE